MQNQALYDRIISFDIDGAKIPLSFASRLARENRWTLDYANRVVTEYKKFVFLAMTAPHICSPSEAVDQAWHLHLTYTRSYWGRFVPDVLGSPLHHDPTKGGSEEDSKHENLYERTLETYLQVFGEAPPPDIWSPVTARFTHDVDWIKVNPQEHWLLKKPSASLAWAVGVSLVLAFVLIGCTADYDAAAPVFIAFTVACLAGIGLIAIRPQKNRPKRRRTFGPLGDSGSDGCGSGEGGIDCGNHHHGSHSGGHDGGGHGGDSGGGHGCGDHGCGGHGCGGHGCGGGGH